MSYKSLQLSPLSTRTSTFRICIEGPGRLSTVLGPQEAEFFRSWLIYDPELDTHRCLTRDVMLGMALVFAISLSFWAGVGFAVAQLWR